MKKLGYLFVLIVTGIALASCVDITIVDSIELDWTPAIEYAQDAEVLLNDKTVTVNFTTGNPLQINISNAEIEKESGIIQDGSNFYLDTSTLGTFTLKISYQGSSVSIQYRVIPEEPTASVVTTDGELRTLVANATDTFVVTLGANITLTGNLTSSHLFSIDTTVDYELDLGGFTININIPEGEDDYIDTSFAFTGSFVNGFVNVSSVFENTPNIGYLFTNSAVANEAVFDSVVVPLGTGQAGLQAVIDDVNVEVLLLQEGQYDLDTQTSQSTGNKTAALFINSKTLIIGQTNGAGEPASVISGNNTISNALLLGGSQDISLINIVLSDYEIIQQAQDDRYTTAAPGAVIYSLGSIHGSDEFTGTLLLDNLVFEKFMKNAMALYGGEVYLQNSVLDATNQSGKDVHLVNGIQGSGDSVMYVENNYFDGFASIYPEDYTANEWSSVAVYTVYGGEIALLANNIITNSDYGFLIDNYWAHASYQGIFGGVYEDFTLGNTFFDNNRNLFVYFGVASNLFSQYSTFAEIVNSNNSYPRFDDYENSFASYIYVKENLEVDTSVTMEQGVLYLDPGVDVAFDSGITLTLNDVSSIVVKDTATIDESSIDFFAWYMDGNDKVYVASIDQIEEGTEYTTFEGVTYTK